MQGQHRRHFINILQNNSDHCSTQITSKTLQIESLQIVFTRKPERHLTLMETIYGKTCEAEHLFFRTPQRKISYYICVESSRKLVPEYNHTLHHRCQKWQSLRTAVPMAKTTAAATCKTVSYSKTVMDTYFQKLQSLWCMFVYLCPFKSLHSLTNCDLSKFK